jgi:single-strand DNA-binding protein
MHNMNHVNIIGRLTRDVELSRLPSGTAAARMSVAVNRGVKKDDQWTDEASFFDVSMYGKLIESLSDKGWLSKGTPVGIDGFLRQDRWKDKETGRTRSRIVIVATDIEVLKWEKPGDMPPQEEEDYDPSGMPDDEAVPF